MQCVQIRLFLFQSDDDSEIEVSSEYEKETDRSKHNVRQESDGNEIKNENTVLKCSLQFSAQF